MWDLPYHVVIHDSGRAPVVAVQPVDNYTSRVLKRLRAGTAREKQPANGISVQVEGKCKQYGMPWMHEVLKRLPQERVQSRSPLIQRQVETVCCFIACIGLWMNQVYADFNMARVFFDSMSWSVSELRNLRVQGFDKFRSLGPHIISRLARDIKFKFGEEEPPRNKQKVEEEQVEEEEEAPHPAEGLLREPPVLPEHWEVDPQAL